MSSDLSLEFLMGRALDNAMLNVGLKTVAKGKFSKVTMMMFQADDAYRWP